MQSILLYGRVVSRVVFAGLSNDFQYQPLTWNSSCSQQKHRPFHLIAASAGIGKTKSTARVSPKWEYGDDACFLVKHNNADVIGVADGVGGWRSYGIDPSVFSRTLMTQCERMVKEGHFKPQEPKEILKNSYEELKEIKSPILGSCTACVVSLDKDKSELHSANLGDSGFLLVRKGQVVHRSEEQQHYFNTPFQLSVAPNSLQGVVLSDSPEAAQASSFDVEKGDILLVGTDGLFDNMNEETILYHLGKLKEHRLQKSEKIQEVADIIVQEAHELAFDPDFMSPFALHAADNGFNNVKGGKPDDITVVLACVSDVVEPT